jgi:DNA repair protein RadC
MEVLMDEEKIIARALGVLDKRMRVGNALNSPSAVRDYLKLLLSGREHEVFVVMHLDAQNRVLDTEEMFRGTLTQTSV